MRQATEQNEHTEKDFQILRQQQPKKLVHQTVLVSTILTLDSFMKS